MGRPAWAREFYRKPQGSTPDLTVINDRAGRFHHRRRTFPAIVALDDDQLDWLPPAPGLLGLSRSPEYRLALPPHDYTDDGDLIITAEPDLEPDCD